MFLDSHSWFYLDSLLLLRSCFWNTTNQLPLIEIIRNTMCQDQWLHLLSPSTNLGDFKSGLHPLDIITRLTGWGVCEID
jgi:hypothetical protein